MRGTIWLLVFGLVSVINAAEKAPEAVAGAAEMKIKGEIAKGIDTADYTPSDKTKRGVTKLTSSDNPSFNHLSTASSATAGTSAVKTSANGQAPFRYVYNNQYYQPNQYVPFVQSSQAAQIAGQYSFQPSGVSHYLQTPSQIQYVSTPSIATRFQTVNTKIGTTSSNTPSLTSQYHVMQAQPLYVTSPQSLQSLYQAQGTTPSAHPIATAAATSSSTSQYQAPAQQLYYQQQPILMLLVQQQPQPAALMYPSQQQQIAYILGQQPFFNIFNSHRFALPYTAATPNNQITYLVPMAVQTPANPPVTSVSTIKSIDKSPSGIQMSPSASTYGLRTNKA